MQLRCIYQVDTATCQLLFGKLFAINDRIGATFQQLFE